MKRLLSFSLGCVALVCVLIATEQRAMAMYVDPGSGLLALQSAASVVAAAAFFLRKKIRAVFGLRRKPEGYIPLDEEKVTHARQHESSRG
jgi:hypothetical protein